MILISIQMMRMTTHLILTIESNDGEHKGPWKQQGLFLFVNGNCGLNDKRLGEGGTQAFI